MRWNPFARRRKAPAFTAADAQRLWTVLEDVDARIDLYEENPDLARRVGKALWGDDFVHEMDREPEIVLHAAIELPFIREEDWHGAYIGVTAQQALEDMVLLSAERIKAHEAGADLE